ncbi:MAG: glycosyltransferase family 2 protein [Chloroflexota bacterium]
MVKTLISILNWNNAESTIQCVQSLHSLQNVNYSIVVIDNGSEDNSVNELRKIFPDLLIHLAGENLGFAAGHELAIRHLKEDDYHYLWIINNDTIVEPNSLINLLKAVDELGDNALYSSIPFRQRDDDTIAFYSKYLLTPTYPKNTLHDYLPITMTELFGYEKSPKEVSALPGSCLLIPRAVIESYGFMSHDYFLYGEEIDYCFRLKGLDIPSYLVPTSYIYHEGEGSTKASSRLGDVVRYYRTRNVILKNMRFDTWFITLMSIFFNTRLAIFTILMSIFSRNKDIATGIMIFRGVLDAIVGNLGKTIPPEDYI